MLGWHKQQRLDTWWTLANAEMNHAGAQWEKANEVFEEMQSQGCTPDVVTYTALISSYEKGGQWRRALQAYNQMRHQRCVPDSIVYNAIIDALWETGVIWAQRQVGAPANIHLALLTCER